jgi:hypothetical protein
VCAAGLFVSAGSPVTPPTPVTRARMIAVAREIVEHPWTCRPANRLAPCSPLYRSRWRDNEQVVGIPYDWGGMDDVAAFDTKLAGDQAAGSHKEEGVTACTTGIDCSGLVALCWGQSHKFGTTTLTQIARALNVNVFTDLKPGDALNRPGEHVVLFVGYNPDGTISVYEASGSASRAVLTRSAWARFKGYTAIRYAGVVD